MASGGGAGYTHGGHRAEAERWLNIAQKLLITRDLNGTKTFAIRARDSDPTFEAAHQMIAVVNTLLSAELGVATNSHPFDWYAILQLPHLCPNVELAATQYRKLALILTPERNHLPFADHAFRLVCEAWSVISNPAKKAFYDGELHLSQLTQQQQRAIPTVVVSTHQHAFRPPPPPQLTLPSPPPPHPTLRSPPLPHPTLQSPPPPHPTLQSPPSSQLAQRPPPFPQPSPSPPPPPPLNTMTSAVPTPSPATPVRKVATANDNRKQMEKERTSNQQSEGTRFASTHSGATTESQVSTFWTACPYCYILYEYPKVYEDCTLRCQNCRRAFQAVMIPSPPVTNGSISEYFCCWGFYPLGYSGDLKDLNPSGWSPFSPMFACPEAKPKKRNHNTGPRVYYDDDDYDADVYDAESDDDEWQKDERRKKKTKKVKETVRKSARNNEDLSNRTVNMPLGNRETNRKGLAGNSGSKQMGKGMKDLGKLDLNVDLSNEGDEPARGVNVRIGNGGEEENIAASGFFEGLDEFLSTMPILNAVGDDMVKAS